MATSASSKSVSRSDLIKELERLDSERQRIEAEIEAKAKSDLQGLVDAFQEHLKANDFALADALALMGVGKKTRSKRGAAKPKAPTAADKPVSGVTYRHPKTGEEWTAPEHLRRIKKWLVELVGSSGKKYEDFAAKK